MQNPQPQQCSLQENHLLLADAMRVLPLLLYLPACLYVCPSVLDAYHSLRRHCCTRGQPTSRSTVSRGVLHRPQAAHHLLLHDF